MAFTGRAVYDSGVFEGIAEDVSDVISMISPFETPVLDRLSQAPRPATNVLHEWLEDHLNPNTVTSSTLATATTGATSIELAKDTHTGGAVTNFLQAGAVIQVESTGEYLQITAISGDYITVSREFGGTTAATIAAGTALFVISDAALEGADVAGDISRPRVRKNNYTQIFKKDIIVSGTVQATQQLGGISDEMDYQRTQRLRESLRDLEKAVIRGKTSGNSLGSSSAYRTFDGILARLTTNITTLTAAASLGVSQLNDIVKTAWDNGGTDVDLIVADAAFKKQIDSFNTTRVEVQNRDERFHQRVSMFESTYGDLEVALGRWMPTNSLMVISTQRVHVVPLRGRSYQFVPVSRTGDAEKGMVVGEYTVEVHNEEGMAQAYV